MSRHKVPAGTSRAAALAARALGLMLAAAFALSACGEENDAGAEPAKVDVAALKSITAMTPTQYTAIKRVFVAALEDERRIGTDGDEPFSVEEFESTMKPLLAACDALDADDPCWVRSARSAPSSRGPRRRC